MVTPPYLKQGSTIAVASTARYVDDEQIQISKEIIQNQGFNVIVAPNVTDIHHRFAGDDQARIRFLQLLLDDESLGAIWFARGGYGTLRIIDALNWTKFLKYPKWLIGFSDMTLLHLKLAQLGVASIHGCNFAQIGKLGMSNENVSSVLDILNNQPMNYQFNSSQYNIEGHARGTLVGGNISLICNSIGTDTQLNTEGCILMLEDCNEFLYHYDRMFHQIKRSGMLKNIHGLIIGESSATPEPGEIDFGYSLKEIVLNVCSESYFPICFRAPFGHLEKNNALKLNTEYELKVRNEDVQLRSIL